MSDQTTITDFFDKAVGRQFARDFLFRVKQIDIAGSSPSTKISFDGEEELVYARTASLPGRTIENKTVNYFGQQFNIPGKSTYTNSENFTIEFYHDESVNLRGQFEAASRAVFDNDTSLGEYGVPESGDRISLVALDRRLQEVAGVDLVGASIRDIGEISYAIADGSGEVMTFPVTFSYHFYTNFADTQRNQSRDFSGGQAQDYQGRG
jgi:hypothetical protein